MLSMPNSQAVAALTQLLAAGGPFHGAKIALFSAGGVPGPGSVLADYTLAAFTGSTPVALTWGPVYVDPVDGYAYSDAWVTFTMTAGSAEVDIGYVIVDTAGTVLVAGDLLPSPFQASGVGAQFEAVVRVRFGRNLGSVAIIVP